MSSCGRVGGKVGVLKEMNGKERVWGFDAKAWRYSGRVVGKGRHGGMVFTRWLAMSSLARWTNFQFDCGGACFGRQFNCFELG